MTVEDEAWTRGMEADLPGIEAPPHLSAWLADLPDDLRTIVNRLCSEGHGVWVVGGAVRDAMQEKKVHGSDIDLATSSPPEETMALFGDRALPTGVEFGTVTVKGEAQHYEVTTLRTE